MMEAVDREVATPDALRRRARRLREAAADLEALAGLRDPNLMSPPDWAAVLHGDWLGQRAEAEAASDSRHTTRQQLAVASTTAAITSALRGDAVAATGAAVRAESIAPEDEHVRTGVGVARAIVWFARGDMGVAFDTLAGLMIGAAPAAVGAVAGLLAESAFRSHHEDRARAALEAVRSVPVPTGAAGEEARLAAALVSSSDQGDAMVELLASGELSSPFARARLQLALGMWFRRRRSPTEARRHLQISLDHFSAIGALPWIGPARNELRATGLRQPGSDDEALSDQQVLIASMAARGLTNREIAQRLFISPRTVSSHLYRIFPKLGITSRSQLGAGLAIRRSRTEPLSRRIDPQDE
jgi:DNA-binding NarL/FixJ family response regulator